MLLKNAAAAEIHSAIELIRVDETLWVEKNFIARSEAIDFLEFQIIERIHALAESPDATDIINELKQLADRLKSDLEEVNNTLFYRLRTKISQEGYRGKPLRNLISECLDHTLNASLHPEIIGYDNLDLLLNGMLTHQKLPVETKNREPEMVFYQKTPARIVFELVDKAEFKPSDVFIDLGSGLGQVVLLVNLLAGITSTGIEYEPAFCDYAKKMAAGLNLDPVSFINADARDADFSTGTVFFMYTPFEGKMLRDAMQILYREALKRKIKIFTYGPCTPEVAKEDWLEKTTDSTGELGAFRSV